MAKPKLCLIPSAQGDKFYSVLPSSGVGDFDFTRSGGATRINSQGLIETVADGVSRLNYPLIDGKVVGCPSHLLENSATNFISYSEDFSQWTIGGTVTITDNQIISPDGTQNASILDFTSANSSSGVYRFSGDRTGSLSRSIYLKGAVGGETLDLSDPHMGGGSNITLTTEWQRFEYISTVENTNSGIWLKNSVGNIIHAWGGQLEENDFVTSYIPTNGNIATRSAETANNSGDASTFNDSEGVLMAEISALANDGTSRRLTISDGSTSNRVSLEVDETANKIVGIIVSGGSSQASMEYTSSNILTYNKISVKYKENDFSIWFNGFEVATDASGSNPIGLNDLSFNAAIAANNFYGNTKQIQYYDSALTDSELETLTSWVSFSDMAEGQLYSVE